MLEVTKGLTAAFRGPRPSLRLCLPCRGMGTARGLAGRTEQGRVAEREEGWEKVSREEGRVSVGTMCEQVVGARMCLLHE